MLTIPILYSVVEERRLLAGKPTLSSDGISLSDIVPAAGLNALKSGKERGKVIVADIVSLNSKRFNPSFMEYCKTPGNDLWIIESLNHSDDVFDAFLGNANKIIFPCKNVRSDSEFDKIIEISDNCIPLLMTSDKIHGMSDIEKDLRFLSSKGFTNIMVADYNNSISETGWKSYHDLCDGLISYSPRHRLDTCTGILAEDVFPVTVL